MEPGLPLTSITFELGTLATLGFYLIAAVYIVFSAIMYYHWSAYSTNKSVNSITLTLYLATTIPLMCALFYTAFTI